MRIEEIKKVLEAFFKLLFPFGEAVIHNLKTGKIEFISGELSKRKVGDDSLINLEDISDEIEEFIYSKMEFSGRRTKSVSVKVGDFLICLNTDVTVFEELNLLISKFLVAEEKHRPRGLFDNDWREKVNQSVAKFLLERGWNMANLKNKDKKEIVFFLAKEGAFAEKNAADYIAEVLDLGRATVFNYLREWKNAD